jgi:putative hydrolase of HD superfamily
MMNRNGPGAFQRWALAPTIASLMAYGVLMSATNGDVRYDTFVSKSFMVKGYPMHNDEAARILQFLHAAERLKNVYRTSWTSDGQAESTASHTWRLSLMVVVLGQYLPDVDIGKLLKICIIHDLGEAIGGDIPAIHQSANAPKSLQERDDLLHLVAPLPDSIRQEIIDLWDEYDQAATLEARVAKALDKLETLVQHNQGANPPDFDYVFNIEYGRKYTDAVPLAAQLRAIIDGETRRKAFEVNGYEAPPT